MNLYAKSKRQILTTRKTKAIAMPYMNLSEPCKNQQLIVLFVCVEARVIWPIYFSLVLMLSETQIGLFYQRRKTNVSYSTPGFKPMRCLEPYTRETNAVLHFITLWFITWNESVYTVHLDTDKWVDVSCWRLGWKNSSIAQKKATIVTGT